MAQWFKQGEVDKRITVRSEETLYSIPRLSKSIQGRTNLKEGQNLEQVCFSHRKAEKFADLARLGQVRSCWAECRQREHLPECRQREGSQQLARGCNGSLGAGQGRGLLSFRDAGDLQKVYQLCDALLMVAPCRLHRALGSMCRGRQKGYHHPELQNHRKMVFWACA